MLLWLLNLGFGATESFLVFRGAIFTAPPGRVQFVVGVGTVTFDVLPARHEFMVPEE